MLGVFKNGVVNPPQELYSPASSSATASKSPQETLKDFLASNPTNGFSLEFADKGFLAYASPQRQFPCQQRSNLDWIFFIDCSVSVIIGSNPADKRVLISSSILFLFAIV